jgi:hypothetical protein
VQFLLALPPASGGGAPPVVAHNSLLRVLFQCATRCGHHEVAKLLSAHVGDAGPAGLAGLAGPAGLAGQPQ